MYMCHITWRIDNTVFGRVEMENSVLNASKKKSITENEREQNSSCCITSIYKLNFLMSNN
jgi:hypothetical protein